MSIVLCIRRISVSLLKRRRLKLQSGENPVITQKGQHLNFKLILLDHARLSGAVQTTAMYSHTYIPIP